MGGWSTLGIKQSLAIIMNSSLARLIDEWKGAKAGGDVEEAEDEEDLYIKELKTKDEEEALREAMEAGKEGRFTAHVKVPTQKDIEEALLRRKKQELLEMLAIDSHDLDQLEKEAKLEPKEVDAEKMETSEDLIGQALPVEQSEKSSEDDVHMSDNQPDDSATVTVMDTNESKDVTEKPPGDE